MQQFFQKTNIDLTVSGPVLLGTVQNDCLLPFIFFHAKQRTAPQFTYCIFSIGTNAPDYNNWIFTEDLGELLLNRHYGYIGERSGKTQLFANDSIYLNITNPVQSGDLIVDAYGYGFTI